ncbi:MAG TPA: hypothetical protein VN650_10335 [Gemmatimonadaceae bacterium]|nr:hypothetical protein [Gemmatimonadaceae bacterium]
MAEESTNDHPEPKFVDSETALGGADAVEKTTYVVGEGTDPNALSPSGHPAKVDKRGLSPAVWIMAGIIVLLVVVYAFGAMRG